eukprot:TRINITY_DN8026_c0_g1_i4.p1 TRINITY_DN8026_c0_g1~~TRINITY_DN8026_c0_g1_i4.p1  ORF type:complete len:303 (+),score=80.15 TRINITY_DN8026_c0_g1_i4:191-1099(+)
MQLGKQAFPEVSEDPTFIVLKDYDEGKALFSRYGLPKRYFKLFLRFHENPLVSNCTGKLMKYVGPGQENSEKTLVMLFYPSDYTSLEELEKEFRGLAEERRGDEYAFLMANITEEPCKKFAEENGIRAKKDPTLQIVRMKDWQLERFAHQGPFTKQGMGGFFKSWKEGSVQKAYKSAEPPEPNPGPVYKVVGQTFADIVLNPSQDVFVKFYAPWCGHCRRLEPVYEELAKKLATNERVKLVEVDSTENEIPNTQVSGYPTLKLYRAADKKHPVTYDGERTVEAMEKFLKENSSFKDETKTDL